MKTAITLLTLLTALASSAQTNQATATTNVVAIVLHTNLVQAPANFRRIGNAVYDLSKPNKFTNIVGTVNAVQDGLVLVDIEKYHQGAVRPLTGQAAIGAYSAGPSYGPGYYEFDKTVAVTNSPLLKTATENQKVEIYALPVGSIKVEGHALEFYDYGAAWIYPQVQKVKQP